MLTQLERGKDLASMGWGVCLKKVKVKSQINVNVYNLKYNVLRTGMIKATLCPLVKKMSTKISNYIYKYKFLHIYLYCKTRNCSWGGDEVIKVSMVPVNTILKV